jgi:hypothetical protein
LQGGGGSAFKSVVALNGFIKQIVDVIGLAQIKV